MWESRPNCGDLQHSLYSSGYMRSHRSYRLFIVSHHTASWLGGDYAKEICECPHQHRTHLPARTRLIAKSNIFDFGKKPFKQRVEKIGTLPERSMTESGKAMVYTVP